MTLNLFYQEPDGDRWLPLDRYPRRLIRRLVREPRQPGGMERYFLNLAAGLKRCGITHHVNGFNYARRHPDDVVGIVGKGHLLRERAWRNPIVFGPAVFSHPLNDPVAFTELPIRLVLVSCEWMKRMYETALNVPVAVWASGIDCDTWQPAPQDQKDVDVLIYDKIRWERFRYEAELISPIHALLKAKNLRFETIRYGAYREENFQKLLGRARSMIFLCEHETQGFAYLQTLASGVPILAWDRGGPWKDPEFFPERVNFSPVTSVPYWDERCGVKFESAPDFERQFDGFWDGVLDGKFRPREYVTENLSLEGCALRYVELAQKAAAL